MTNITDDFMKEMLPKAKSYCLLILKSGPNRNMEGANHILWEHARRNFALRAEGLLSIVCPVADGTEIAGIGIFNAPPAEVQQLYAEDPAVKAGILTFEVHPCRGF